MRTFGYSDAQARPNISAHTAVGEAACRKRQKSHCGSLAKVKVTPPLLSPNGMKEVAGAKDKVLGHRLLYPFPPEVKAHLRDSAASTHRAAASVMQSRWFLEDA